MPFHCRILFAFFLLLLFGGGATLPATEVEVQLASGRSFVGKIDPRTDQDKLWLRAEAMATAILRPIRWTAVQSVTVGGISVQPAEFKQQAAANATEFKPQFAASATTNEPTHTSADRATQLLGLQKQRALTQDGMDGSIRSLNIDAQLANLDADSQADGLRVRLFAQNAQGQLLPPTGVVTVEVYGFQKVGYDARPHGRGERLTKLTRHVVKLSDANLRADGTAVVAIPFSHNLGTDVYALGLVHAELVIPGQGVFEASRDAVRIQPFAPTRDALQRKGESRLLATE